MDYKTYKATYEALLSERGRDELGSDIARRDALEKKINEFLKLYPSVVPADSDPARPVTEVSLRELTHRSLKVMVDIINDVSELLGMRETLGATDFRRRMFRVFTAPERRLYVGVWIILLSLVLYFIDAAA
jgi:hypothetical protein